MLARALPIGNILCIPVIIAFWALITTITQLSNPGVGVEGGTASGPREFDLVDVSYTSNSRKHVQDLDLAADPPSQVASSSSASKSESDLLHISEPDRGQNHASASALLHYSLHQNNHEHLAEEPAVEEPTGHHDGELSPPAAPGRGNQDEPAGSASPTSALIDDEANKLSTLAAAAAATATSSGSSSSSSSISSFREHNEINPPERSLLTYEFANRTCSRDRGVQRSELFNETYLSKCSRYRVDNLLSLEILDMVMHRDSKDCVDTLNEFIQLDETINQFDDLFIRLLSRYNCHNGYSVKWNCDDCKKAYKDWLCTTHLPFYMNGERIKPCISFCERVEQRCPYLHPITREQYGGQPVFICRDPNIPFVPEITPDIPYSDPGKCYDLCHLSDNLTELITDSLSRYDYDRCPSQLSIAGEVKSETEAQTNDSLPRAQVPGSAREGADYLELSELGNDESALVLANRTGPSGQTKVYLSQPERKRVHVHNKKLEELREVLANYQNQAKTHRYHADHSSVEHSRSQSDLHHRS